MKRILLAVLIIILVLIVALVAFFYFNRDKIAQVAIEKSIPLIQTTMENNLPENVNADEVKKVFQKVTDKVKSGEYDMNKIQGLLLDFRNVAADKKIDQDEFDKFYKELQDFVK